MQSDAELVDCVRRGNWEAFRPLAERYQRSVLAIAWGALRDLHAAEDVAQTVLLLAFRRLASLRDSAKFGPWLMQIARRQVIEAVRNRKVPVVAECEASAASIGVPSEVAAVDEREHLMGLVQRLPDHERLLVGLRYFDGYSIAEVAFITSRPVGTVTKQLSRAHARLRECLREEEQ